LCHRLCRGREQAPVSIAPKSVTTPVEMGLNGLATTVLLPAIWGW
jgi:putative effector of murein hydrolase